jgi:hypothetical protein
LHWPITQRRYTQNSPNGSNQASWEARPPSPTPPGVAPHGLAVVPGDKLLLVCGPIGQYAVAAPLVPFFVFIKVSAYSPEAKICLTSFHYDLNSAPFDVFILIISSTVSPARSLETMTALVASCWLIYTGKCLFVFVSAS